MYIIMLFSKKDYIDLKFTSNSWEGQPFHSFTNTSVIILAYIEHSK
jgi:hypothetical protein